MSSSIDSSIPKNALDGTHSYVKSQLDKKGQYWTANFENEVESISKVKVLSRYDEEGDQLGNAEILIDDQLFGCIQDKTQNGQWYDVTSKHQSIQGKSISIRTTNPNQFLTFTKIEVYTEQI